MNLDPVVLALLTFITGLAAGWVDSIAGGGGMLSIPVLLWMGVPPPMVLGTNKFQASFGSLTASYHYIRKDVVSLRDALPGIIWTIVGSAVGAWAVQQLDPTLLGVLIPILLLAIALYMLVVPTLGNEERAAKVRRGIFYCVAGLGLGFYDGFFGPGVGSFWAIVFVTLMGFSLTRATGYTKVMNFTSNVVSLVVFALGGHVLYTAGFSMAAGQIVGARLGSGLVVTKGARLIRPIFIAMVLLVALKLLLDRI